MEYFLLKLYIYYKINFVTIFGSLIFIFVLNYSSDKKIVYKPTVEKR